MNFPLYYLTWNTTFRCNLKCKHCYNNLSGDEKISDELSTREGTNVISQAIPLGLRALLFTGGEPLLREDLLELMEFAKKKKLLIFLATNGTLINNNFVKDFKGLIDKVNISLDASSAEKHDAIRGEKGSFLKAVRAVENLRKKFNVSIAFTVHSENLTELPLVAAMAKEYKVLLTIKRFIPIGRGSQNINLTLSQSQYKILIEGVNQLKNVQEISFNDPFPSSSNKKIDSYGGCLAGIYSLSIDFNGNIYPCTKLKLFIGNIRTNSLIEIWKNSKSLRQLRKRALKDKCRNCERIFSCGGCRAAAFAETGDFLDSDPLCFYQKGRN